MKISLFPKCASSREGGNPAHIAANPALQDFLDYLVDVAIVSKDISPFQSGRVYFQSSWWPAVCLQNVQIPAGETVRVVGRSNITLLVEPLLNHRAQ